MFFRIQPLPGYPVELDMVRMRDYIDDNVRPRMERVPGVASVSVVGGAEAPGADFALTPTSWPPRASRSPTCGA